MDIETTTLGARLREAREYLRLSQDEVARVVGLPRAAISLIESGRRKVAALELKKFADLYQRPVTYFTGDVEVASPVRETVQHLARVASKLAEADQAELVRFAEFLGSRVEKKREA